MTKIKIIRLLCLLFIFTTAPLSYADEHKNDEFSISLPPKWVEIPREALDSFEKGLTTVGSGFTAVHYNYGFQLKSAKNWFEYPYILIQVDNSGRIPKIETWERIPLQNRIQGELDQFSSFISGSKMGEIFLDKQNKLIWMPFEFYINNVGLIKVISGIIPTETGKILVLCYSEKTDYPKFDSIFRSIILSTSPNADLEYKTNWAENIPSFIGASDWADFTGKLVLIIMGFGALSILFYIIRISYTKIRSREI